MHSWILLLKDKYVGDILSADKTNTAKIKERTDKGFGIVNEICAIIDEIPLGPYKISVGLKLREAILINGMLFNSEVWYNVTEDEIKKLCEVDEYLSRKILNLPAKTPKEALYLETGCIPINFCLKKDKIDVFTSFAQKT